jgi:hypothetical protein
MSNFFLWEKKKLFLRFLGVSREVMEGVLGIDGSSEYEEREEEQVIGLQISVRMVNFQWPQLSYDIFLISVVPPHRPTSFRLLACTVSTIIIYVSLSTISEYR